MFHSLAIFACATCANSFKHGGQDAAGWSIAVMLMTILPLICSVVWFFARLAKRESVGLEDKYRDDYVTPVSSN